MIPTKEFVHKSVEPGGGVVGRRWYAGSIKCKGRGDDMWTISFDDLHECVLCFLLSSVVWCWMYLSSGGNSVCVCVCH